MCDPSGPTTAERCAPSSSRISPDSIWFRFFGTPSLDWATTWSVNVDYADRFGLVVESGNPRAIIAHAAYVRIDSGPRRSGVPGRRRMAGARNLDDPARPSCGSGRAARDLDVLRAGAAAQPPDDRGLPRERIPGQAPVAHPMRSRSSCRPRCRPQRSSGSRNASGSGRWPRSGASSSRARWP